MRQYVNNYTGFTLFILVLTIINTILLLLLCAHLHVF